MLKLNLNTKIYINFFPSYFNFFPLHCNTTIMTSFGEKLSITPFFLYIQRWSLAFRTESWLRIRNLRFLVVATEYTQGTKATIQIEKPNLTRNSRNTEMFSSLATIINSRSLEEVIAPLSLCQILPNKKFKKYTREKT